jgi:hypothetical protein
MRKSVALVIFGIAQLAIGFFAIRQGVHLGALQDHMLAGSELAIQADHGKECNDICQGKIDIGIVFGHELTESIWVKIPALMPSKLENYQRFYRALVDYRAKHWDRLSELPEDYRQIVKAAVDAQSK